MEKYTFTALCKNYVTNSIMHNAVKLFTAPCKHDIYVLMCYLYDVISLNMQCRISDLTNESVDSVADEEEEIDVVSFEKQATYLNFASAKHHRIQRNKKIKNLVADTHDTFTSRRPRGRPPGPSSTRRRAHTQTNQVSRRCRVQNHQRAERRQNYTQQNEDEAENESNQRRHMHNNMERERRVTLKNLFERLKNYVPQIAGNQKVSKVSILRNARLYITDLQDTYEKLDEKLTDLKRQQIQLKAYLNNRALHRRN